MRSLGIAALLIGALVFGCQSRPSNSGANLASGDGSPTAFPPNSTAVLHVQGMSCPLCAHNIDQQLLGLRGVEKVSVDLGTGEVRARISTSNPPSQEELVDAIKRSGFTLSGIEMPNERSVP